MDFQSQQFPPRANCFQQPLEMSSFFITSGGNRAMFTVYNIQNENNFHQRSSPTAVKIIFTHGSAHHPSIKWLISRCHKRGSVTLLVSSQEAHESTPMLPLFLGMIPGWIQKDISDIAFYPMFSYIFSWTSALDTDMLDIDIFPIYIYISEI